MSPGLFRSLAAAALASGVAFAVNRAASRGGRPGPLVAFMVGPAVEEVAKTGFAVAFAASVTLVHLGFGAAEAVYDICWGRSARGGGAPGLAAGILSLVSHGALGVLVRTVVDYTGELLPAVGAAFAAHALWNVGMVALTAARPRRQ